MWGLAILFCRINLYKPDAAKTENLFSSCIVRRKQKAEAIHGFLEAVMSVRSPKTLPLLPNDINLRKMNLTIFCQIILPTADKTYNDIL